MESAREHVANALQAYQSLTTVQKARECTQGAGGKPCGICVAYTAIADRMTKALVQLDGMQSTGLPHTEAVSDAEYIRMALRTRRLAQGTSGAWWLGSVHYGQKIDEAIDALLAEERGAQSAGRRESPKWDCRACGKPLDPSLTRVADGCPCNSPRGINHGLVPANVCTCVLCDPAQTGAARGNDSAEEEAKAREFDGAISANRTEDSTQQGGGYRGK